MSVKEKESSVDFPTLPAVLSVRALGLVAVPVSEKEGSVGKPALPAAVLSSIEPFPGETSERS